MSIATLILGESGTGKSTSLRHLDPKQTLLIQAVRKPLPFKSKDWKPFNKNTREGNVIVTDDAALIERAMRTFAHPVVVIDDWQYILANEFMRRSDEKGFEKFTDIGRHAWDILQAASGLSEGRRVYILAHTASDEFGHTKVKTIGKLLDEKITVEGLFSIVLRTSVSDGSYRFSTRNNGRDTVKSPLGMFDDPFIDNDLASVDAAICDFYGIEQQQAQAA
jgi:hypothetical protein